MNALRHSHNVKDERIRAVFKYYRAAQKCLLSNKTCPQYCIRGIVKHLLLPHSFSNHEEKRKIVTKIVMDGTAFGFHVEDEHRRKILQWNYNSSEQDNRRRSRNSLEYVFVEFMLARWEHCMLEMGKTDPKRLLQAAHAFSDVMDMESRFYTMGNRVTDICQEITSKLTAPGRKISSVQKIIRRRGMRLNSSVVEDGADKGKNNIPNHVAPIAPTGLRKRIKNNKPRHLTNLRTSGSYKSLNSIRNRMRNYSRKFGKQNVEGETLLEKEVSVSGLSVFQDLLRQRSSSSDGSKLRSPGRVGLRSPGSVGLRSPGRVGLRSPGRGGLRSPRRVGLRSPGRGGLRSPEKTLLSPGQRGAARFRQTLTSSTLKPQRKRSSSSVFRNKSLKSVIARSPSFAKSLRRKRSSSHSVGLPPGLENRPGLKHYKLQHF